MKKLIIVSMAIMSISANTELQRPPIVGSVMAAGEAVVDTPAGLFGKSTHKDQNRVPVLGVVEAGVKNAVDIVAGFFGFSVYKDRNKKNKPVQNKDNHKIVENEEK